MDLVLVSLPAIQGWLMAAIPPLLVGALLCVGLLYLLGADVVKVRLFHALRVR